MKNKIPIPILVLVLTFFVLTAHLYNLFQVELPYPVSNLKWHSGDSAAYKQMSFRDSEWSNKVPVPFINQWWLRYYFTIDSSGPDRPNALRIELQGAYDIYLNGVFLERNGKPGINKLTEIPGQRIYHLLLPETLIRKENVLALRISSFHNQINQYPIFTTGNYESLIKSGFLNAVFMNILAGIFFIIAIYFSLIYFFTFRYTYHLIFAGISILFFLLILLDYSGPLLEYNYVFHQHRIIGISVLTSAICILIPLFFQHFFDAKFPYAYLPLLLMLSIAIFLSPSFRDYNKTVGLMSFALSLIIVYQSLKKKKAYSTPSFYVVAVLFLLINPNYAVSVHFGFACLIIFMLLNLLHLHNDQKKLHRQIEVRSARLETELLKKNIEPHFLLNSLTSLMELIETDPEKSTRFIEALAEEFKMLNAVSSKKLIALADEIELCNRHLEIMSFRKECSISMKLNNFNKQLEIPPGIMLTIIENWITHNRISKRNNEISVTVLENNQYFSIQVHALADNVEGKAMGTGTGVKYIIARLEESFPKKWEFSNDNHSGTWISTIKIKKE